MKRYLSALVCLVSLSVFGAAGDYIGAQVDPSGWQLWLEFAAMGTNGVFAANGLATNGTPTGSEAVKLTLLSQGFDSAGAATTYARVIYGTKGIRFPATSNAFPDVSSNSVSTTIKVALSDFVTSGDSNLTVTVAAGFYSSNSVNSAAVTAMPVTNNSVAVYPTPVANWTWPGYQRITNSTMRLRAVGFAQTADNGQPLACMKFIVTDGTTTKTNTVSSMAIDRTLPDAIPFAEYYTDVDMSGFIPYAVGGAGGLLWCNFQAFPRLGTASTVYATPTNSVAGPQLSSYALTITNLCDTNAVYAARIAVVEPGGSDSNGRVTNVAPASVNTAHYFATVRGAALQLAATNNLSYGHNDPGGCTIYVKSTVTNWAGATGDITSTPVTWLDIQPYPGDTVAFTTQNGSFYAGNRIKFTNLGLGGGGSANMFFGVTAIWMDQCTINTSSGNFCRSCMWFSTDCTVPLLGQGFKMIGGSTMPPVALVRGCNVTGAVGIGAWQNFQTIVGNHQYSNTSSQIVFDVTGASTIPALGPILYNNVFNARYAGGQFVNGYANTNMDYHGAAIVQNVFEMTTNVGQLVAVFSFASSVGHVHTNVIVWNNAFLGQRNVNWYNDATDGFSAIRDHCQMLNNFAVNYNLKSDMPLSPAPRTNNWQQMFAVGWQGNAWAETTDTNAAPAQFMNSMIGGFAGMNTIEHTNIYGTLWPRFVSPQYYDGGAFDWPGEGNYRIYSDSPQLTIKTRCVLPYDIDGKLRNGNDPPGPFCYSRPRDSKMFFSQ